MMESFDTFLVCYANSNAIFVYELARTDFNVYHYIQVQENKYVCACYIFNYELYYIILYNIVSWLVWYMYTVTYLI